MSVPTSACRILVALTAMTLAACPAPFFRGDYPDSRQNIGDQVPDFIATGKTTRADVLLALGEPDDVSENAVQFTYTRRTGEGGVLFIVGGGGHVGAFGFEAITFRRLVILFDEAGVVTAARNEHASRTEWDIDGSSASRSSRYTAQRYGSSAENVDSLQEIKKSSSTTVQVAKFTSFQPGLKEIMCRAVGPVEAPDQKPFDVFLRDAIISELKLAGLYGEQSGPMLNGYLEHIDFSSIGTGNWTIQMRFNWEGRTPYTVEHTHSFSTNFLPDIACQQVAQALGPATQEFLRKAFANPSFRQIFQAEKPQ